VSVARGHTSTALAVALACAAAWRPAAAGDDRGDDRGLDLATRLAARGDLVDLATVAPRVRVALAYSTTDNFLGRDVYGDLDRCYLNRDAARMLSAADRSLEQERPDLRLLVYDCVRPLSVQRSMWSLVVGTPKQPYVGDPTGTSRSMHNYGCAVDLTLANDRGVALDMGTAFDQFDERSQPRRERKLIRSGQLTRAQVANRHLLRRVMKAGGFRPIGTEWWHFACATSRQARKRYRVVD